MIARWIFIGIAIGIPVGAFIMGIICGGKIEDYERAKRKAEEKEQELEAMKRMRLGGKVK